MLPVAVLPVAGILLGVGGAFIGNYKQAAIDAGYCTVDGVAVAGDKVACLAHRPTSSSAIRSRPGIVAKPLYIFLQILQGSGDPIFAALGLIFAIGVALGIAKNDGVSALAATVGYLVMNGTIGVVAAARGIKTKAVLGLQTLDTSVFGGILIGIIAGYAVQPLLPDQAAALPGLLRRQTVRAHRHRVRRDRARHRAGLPLAADRQLHREHRQPGHQRQRAGRRVRLRRSSSAPCCRSACTTSGTRRSSSTINIGGWADCNGILTCFFRGHPESGIFGGGFLVKMFGLCGAALAIWRAREAGEPGPDRLDHAGGGADHLPHRHHRAAGVLVPVRRAAAVRGARLPVRLRASP